jgi:Protein of unknown function (DUF559)
VEESGQPPLAPYIVDCYCQQLRLVVEIDGSKHRQQPGYDSAPESYLVRLGIHVLQLPNDAIRDDLPAVMRSIRAAFFPATPTPNTYLTGKGNSKSSAASPFGCAQGFSPLRCASAHRFRFAPPGGRLVCSLRIRSAGATSCALLTSLRMTVREWLFVGRDTS